MIFTYLSGSVQNEQFQVINKDEATGVETTTNVVGVKSALFSLTYPDNEIAQDSNYLVAQGYALSITRNEQGNGYTANCAIQGISTPQYIGDKLLTYEQVRLVSFWKQLFPQIPIKPEPIPTPAPTQPTQ